MKEREVLEKRIQEKRISIEKQVKNCAKDDCEKAFGGTGRVEKSGDSIWNKASDMEAAKRKNNTMNMHRFLEQQMEEKVQLSAWHRSRSAWRGRERKSSG